MCLEGVKGVCLFGTESLEYTGLLFCQMSVATETFRKNTETYVLESEKRLRSEETKKRMEMKMCQVAPYA